MVMRGFGVGACSKEKKEPTTAQKWQQICHNLCLV